MVLISDINILPSAGKMDQIKISRTLYDAWNLASYPILSLKCGRKKQTVQILPDNNVGKTSLICNPILLQTFHLPSESLFLKLSFDKRSYQLELGPIISILTLLKKNAFDGPLLTYCKEMARYSEKHHVLFYVFTLKDWRRESVVGYVWRHRVWDRCELPNPHVIYNRIGQRKLEKLPATTRFIENLSERNIHFFNAHFLDKWQVQEKLASHSELHPYLPETLLYENSVQIEEMLQRHQSVFLKPADGRQGKQIFRIRGKGDHLELDYTTFNGEIERSYSNFKSLFMAIESRLIHQKYVVQQGLDLLKHKQSPLDFRMLCNRGFSGNWSMTSAIARVSSEDQFVSNLARGGSYHSIRDILEMSFHRKEAIQVQKLLKELALEAAEIISLETDGCFAELGVDLAIDEHGKPWIIEINTKPSKDLDPERAPAVIRPSAKAIIDFSCRLSGFVKN